MGIRLLTVLPLGLATKLKTVMAPLTPLYSLNTTLASVTVAMLLPVLEIGPAPPIASSQIITSYCADPVDVEDVNMSYATSATTEDPESVDCVSKEFALAVLKMGFVFREETKPETPKICDVRKDVSTYMSMSILWGWC